MLKLHRVEIVTSDADVDFETMSGDIVICDADDTVSTMMMNHASTNDVS